MKYLICALFAAVAVLDSIRTGAPLAGMLLYAAMTAAVLFAAVEYLSRKGSAAAEMMGRITFIISIVSLTVMPWPTIKKSICVSTADGCFVICSIFCRNGEPHKISISS